MTIRMSEAEVMQAIEGVAWAGSIVAILLAALVFYLLVRPPRHVRQRRKAERRGEVRVGREPDAIEMEDVLRVMDRMEERLEVLERLVAVEARERDKLLEMDAEGAEAGRTK